MYVHLEHVHHRKKKEQGLDKTVELSSVIFSIKFAAYRLAVRSLLLNIRGSFSVLLIL